MAYGSIERDEKKLLSVVALCVVVAIASAPYPSYGQESHRGGHGGGGSHRYAGYARGSRYYSGHYYGGYRRYYYRGYAPRGALFGVFLGGAVIGGVYSPYWWPYYAVPVLPAYYDPYYQYPYAAPPYVFEVPPTDATATNPQGPPPAITPPNQCYAPQIDSNGNVINDRNGSMTPDFSKPVPCPPQQ